MASVRKREYLAKRERSRHHLLHVSGAAWEALSRRDVLAMLAATPLFFLGKAEQPGLIRGLSATKAMFARKIPVRLP
jgi:hypothetical protein